MESKNNIPDHAAKQAEEETESVIPKEFLDAIPAEERGSVSRVLQMMVSGVRPKNPLASKITSDHIGQIIDLGDKQEQRKQEDKQRDRYFNGFIIIVCLLFVAWLVYFLQSDKDLLEKIITLILGFGSGFGVGKLTNKDKKPE